MSLKYDSINIVLQSLKVLHFTNEAAHTLDDLINFFCLSSFEAIALAKASCMIACLHVSAVTVHVSFFFFLSSTALCITVSLRITSFLHRVSAFMSFYSQRDPVCLSRQYAG